MMSWPNYAGDCMRPRPRNRACRRAARHSHSIFCMPYLIISSGGEEIDRRPLTVGPALIGRAPEANIRIRDTSVSRQHCRLDLIGTHWFVTDLNSKNGTNVNGRTVQREQ